MRWLKDEPNITVLINSTQTINEFYESSFRIVSTGGTVNKSTSSMQGSIVRKVLSSLYVDIVLLSCKALSIDGGIFDSNEDEAEIKKLMLERGKKVILLADHSKFEKVAFVRVLGFETLDMLVTDSEPSQEWKDLLKDKGVLLKYPSCMICTSGCEDDLCMHHGHNSVCYAEKASISMLTGSQTLRFNHFKEAIYHALPLASPLLVYFSSCEALTRDCRNAI